MFLFVIINHVGRILIKGKQRSDIKRDVLVKKLDSFSKALTDLTAFYP